MILKHYLAEKKKKKKHCLGKQKQELPLPVLTSQVTLGKSLHLSEMKLCDLTNRLIHEILPELAFLQLCFLLWIMMTKIDISVLVLESSPLQNAFS